MHRLFAILAVLSLPVHAVWAAQVNFAAVLDCVGQAITFSTSGDSPWFEQESVVHTGNWALRSGSVENGLESVFEANVDGAGTFKFWVRIENSSEYAALQVQLDGAECDGLGWLEDTGGRWVQQTVTVADAGPHTISLQFWGDGSEDVCWIDAVSWESAPEEMEISFDTGAGPAVTACKVPPGTTYGELPVPDARDGYDFCGWYRDAEFREKAQDEDFVAFTDHTLYARWARLVSVLDSEAIKFSTEQVGAWHARESEGASGGFVLASYTEAKDGGSRTLVATVKGSGVLSFSVKPKASDSTGSVFLSTMVNDDYVYPSLYYGEWRNVKLTIRGAEGEEQTVRWEASRYDDMPKDGDVILKDFSWTPCTDSITVTYETNGGDDMPPDEFFASEKVTYGGLAEPSREGYDFDGWFLDAELTKRVPYDRLLPFEDITVYACWSIPFSALNTETLSFWNDSDAWRVTGSAAGGYVVKNGSRDGASFSGSLHVCVPNEKGILSFRYRLIGGESFLSYAVNDGDGSYLGMEGGLTGPTDGWREMQIQVLNPPSVEGDDEGSVDVSLMSFSYHDGRISDWSAVQLRDFEWSPAPETVTVSFDTHGAGEIAPMELNTDEKFQALPSPTKKGWTFNGWRMKGSGGGSLMPVTQWETAVPLLDVTLHASWEKPVAALNTDRLKFTASGAWSAYDDGDNVLYGDGGILANRVSVKKTYAPKAVKSYLQAAVTGPMLLSFDLEAWSATEAYPMCYMVGDGTPMICEDGDSVKTIKKGTCAFSLYLDGKKQSGYSIESHEDGGRVTLHIPAGNHTVKWELSGKPKVAARVSKWKWDAEQEMDVPAAWAYTAESSGYAEVRNFEVVDLGPQDDMNAWTRKLKDHRSWIAGDLAKFAAGYRSRVLDDPYDYEARILYAVARLGVLAENAQFKTYAKTFGYTLDYARMTFSGSPKLNKKTAAMNAMADKLLALVAAAVGDVQKVLSGIPEDWAGSVEISADEWPIDETVYVDSADVLFARAGLSAALATFNYLAAHDLTVDYVKADAALNADAIPSVKAVPAAGNADAWIRAARNFRLESKAYDVEGDTNMVESASGSAVLKASTLSLRLECPNQTLDSRNQVRDVDFWIKAGDGTRLNIMANLYGEHGQAEVHGGAASACDPGGEIYYTNGFPYNSRTNVSFDVCLYPADYSYENENDEEVKGVTGSVSVRGGEVVLNVNLAKVANFAKKKWSIQGGEAQIGFWDQVSGAAFGVDEVSEWTLTGSVKWKSPDGLGSKLQKFVANQPAFFSKVRDASRLSAARAQLTLALETALAADGKATDRPDDGKMHFIEYDPEDADKIEFVRANTERILESIAGPADVDFAQIAADFDAAFSNKTAWADYDYTLLPNDGGITRVYLGALFEGRITRALLPDTRLNEYGEVVPDFDTMDDPTIGGLFPDMTRDHIDGLAGKYEGRDRELDHGEWSDPDALPKPGEKLSLTFPQYRGSTASGLPKGWKWNSKNGTLSGTASTTFTVTFKKGRKVVGTEAILVGAKPALLLFVDSEEAVSVKGTGLYNVGATAKAVAAVKAGYAFAGWYDQSGTLVANGATYSFKMPREDVSLTARTLPLEEDSLYVKPAYEDEIDLGSPAFLSPLTVLSGTPFTVSVSGLPPGLSVSNSVEVTEDGLVGTTYLVGTPKKGGVYYVMFATKNNGGYRNVSVVKYNVGHVSESELNTAGIDFSLMDYRLMVAEPYGFSFEIPVNGCSFCGGPVSPVKSIKAKNLPPGMNAALVGGALTIYGTPTTAGKFTMDFTVTYKNKKTARALKTVIVEEAGSVYIPTGVADNDPYGGVRGTATGGGVKQIGQTAKFTATSANKKKWFFAGWYLDPEFGTPASDVLGDVDYRTASVSVYVGEDWCDGDGMYARFVTKEEEEPCRVWIYCDDDWRVYDEESGEATELLITVYSDTLPTLTAKGLPAGLKLVGHKLIVSKASALVPGEYKVTISAKTAVGNTDSKTISVLVPNSTVAVDKGLIEGLDTSDDGYSEEFMQAGVKQSFTLADLGVTVSNGWTLAVTGLPSGWSYNAKTGVFSGIAPNAGRKFVTFTVSQKIGKKPTSYKATAVFNLEPLPDYVVGSFSGILKDTCDAVRLWQVQESRSGLGTEPDPGDRVTIVSPWMVSFEVTPAGNISGTRRWLAAGSTAERFSGTGLIMSNGTYYAMVNAANSSTKWMFELRDEIAETDGFESPVNGIAVCDWQIKANIDRRLESVAPMCRDPWKAEVAGLPVFPVGMVTTVQIDMNRSVEFKVGERGTVTCIHRWNPDSRHSGAVSCSAQLFDLQSAGSDWSAKFVVNTPSVNTKTNSAPSFSAVISIYMTTSEDGVVTEVIPVCYYDTALEEHPLPWGGDEP